MGKDSHLLINNSHVFDIGIRAFPFKDDVIHSQRIAGGETVCCYSSGTFARCLSPFNNLVENSFILDFDCDNIKGKGGEDEKQNDEHSKFKPDASEHSETSR
jgi:hypothetical protein